MALSLLHGLASITFRGNQLISGVAINFLAAGLTVLIAQDWFQQGGQKEGVPADETELGVAIASEAGVAKEAGGGGKKRRHVRRGHWRRFKHRDGTISTRWIGEQWVGSEELGTITHDYNLKSKELR